MGVTENDQNSHIEMAAVLMRFVISQQGAGGRYAVIDTRSRQIRYLGSLDGARAALASLNRSLRYEINE
jgi:hypothetical protein